MRLNKYIASAGICSRRKADELIAQGKVKINGIVIDAMGIDVKDGDRVEVLGRDIKASEKLVYFMLYKPVGYVTTTDDEMDRPAVTDLMGDINERVYPVGRLDFNTSGLLIMTNDGKLAYHLSHPAQKVYKSYLAVVDGPLPKDKLWKLRNGVDIGGYTTRPAMVEVKSESLHKSVVEVKISEGKNRQVRKMFKAVGLNVMELERTAIGNLQLGRLKPGQFRKLGPAEINYLLHC